MKTITITYRGRSGVEYLFEFTATDSFASFEINRITQTYAAAFYNGKLVIVHDGHKNSWGLVGGSVEPGEYPDDTLVREIREESNMRVVSFGLIGVQKVTDTRDNSYVYQLRYWAEVEPFGPFGIDPAGVVDQIAVIEPTDYKSYFDWGEIGDYIITTARQRVA